MRSRLALKVAAATIVCGALLWGAATAVLYASMRQTPDTFGRIMSHMPGVAMTVLPFKPLWMSARSGRLQVGDPAPDFALPVCGTAPPNGYALLRRPGYGFTASFVLSMALSIFSPAFSAGPFSGHALVARATPDRATTMMTLRMIFMTPIIPDLRARTPA